MDLHLRHAFTIGLLACVAVIGTACKGSAAPAVTPTPSASATPAATVPPQPLVQYAQQADPILKQTLHLGATLLQKMEQSPLDLLGNQCTASAVDLSNAHGAFLSITTPYQARNLEKTATLGYKYVLGASDECGLASDGSDKKQLKTAISDLRKGLKEVSQVETATSQWASS